MIYIAHPLRGDVERNKKKVTEIMRDLSDRQILAFSPLHAFDYIDPEGPQKRVLTDCIRVLEKCDELWVYGDAESVLNSTGIGAEVAYAKAVGIPVIYKEGNPVDAVMSRLIAACKKNGLEKQES